MRIEAWLRAAYQYHLRRRQPCEDCGTPIPRRQPEQRHYYPRCGPCLERYAARCEAAAGTPAALDPAALPRW
jgi:hypothetical protein